MMEEDFYRAGLLLWGLIAPGGGAYIWLDPPGLLLCVCRVVLID